MQRHKFSRIFARYLASFLFFFLICSFNHSHPHYVSVTEVRLNSTKKTVQVHCKMFTEDLQAALHQLYNTQASLEKEDTLANDFLRQYLDQRLEIKCGDSYVAFEFVGYENEDESTWCYLEGAADNVQGPVTVNNRLLYDFLETQTNIVHLYRNGKRTKSHKVVNPESVVVFE